MTTTNGDCCIELMKGALVRPIARYPGAIAYDDPLKVASNQVRTTLARNAATGDTLLTVGDASRIVPQMLLSVNSEIVSVSTVDYTTNILTVIRGFDGTYPACHSAGSVLNANITAFHHNALAAEITAIEEALGPNLSNIVTGAEGECLSVPLHNFTPQSPGVALTGGVINSVTLTPVPDGVSGTNIGHYLYISGGTGAAEAVMIVGGTAVSGAASGTILFTPANSHSGAWTIASASEGIEETVQDAMAGSCKVVRLPSKTYTVRAPIFVGSDVTVDGGQASKTILEAAPNVSPVIQVGNASVPAFRTKLANMWVTRQGVYPPPAGTVGIQWYHYSYCYQENVRSHNHDTGIVWGPVLCLGFTSNNCDVDHCVRAYLEFNGAIGIYIAGGNLGINAGIADDVHAGMIISGMSDTIMFTQVEMIPRGNTPPADQSLVKFLNYPGTNGVFYFDQCNVEHWSCGFSSDAASPYVHEIAIRGCRFTPGMVNIFNLHANTKLELFSLTDSSVFGFLNFTKPSWVFVIGNFITSNTVTIVGTGAADSMVFANNIVAAQYNVSGTWGNLSITGNVFHNSSMVVTAAPSAGGGVQVAGNTTNTGQVIGNTLERTNFLGYITLPSTTVLDIQVNLTGVPLYSVVYAVNGLPGSDPLALGPGCLAVKTNMTGNVWRGF